MPSDTKANNETSEEDKKDAIVDAVAQAANNSTTTDEAIKKLNSEDFKAMIVELQNNSEEHARISKTQLRN